MPVETWLNTLHENGYRLTEARKAVVEIVAESLRALTPLEVFDLAHAAYPALGLVSVYRTLEKLEELHLIQRVHQRPRIDGSAEVCIALAIDGLRANPRRAGQARRDGGEVQR